MRFSSSAFNRHLENIGQQVTWSRAYSCSCINLASGTGAPDTRCPHCLGKGHIWAQPQETVCGLSSQKTQQQWMASGQWTDGDIVVTIPGSSVMWDVGAFDRVAMLNGDERFSQPLSRGGAGERLLFNAKSVERVFWIDKETKAIIEGGVPTLDPQGRPVWGNGLQPPPSMTYSITGLRRPEYFCLVEMPSSRNEHSGMRLPKRVVLRRFDLLGRRGATA